VTIPASDFGVRINRVQSALSMAGLAGLVVTPSEDLFYLCGYRALPLERLTALVVPRLGEPVLVVPYLEKSEAENSPARAAGCEIRTWGETDDPFDVVASFLAPDRPVAVDDHMWATRVHALNAKLGGGMEPAHELLTQMRAVKSDDEFDALRRAGAAIDEVHRRIPEFLAEGRTERDVAHDISRAIVESGHERVDFVIVGSGPNGASPHHSVSDRVIGRGDPIVIDIGGTMPDGYRSDCTRNYVVGQPPALYLEAFSVLQVAQEAARRAARAGVTAESVDDAARNVLADAGLGEQFIHRTGHGIGLETHEEPYIVQGSSRILEAGNAFSIEPGFYRDGAFGARIEDIVLCTNTGIESVNNTTRDLVIVD